ncbi:hypothetical protein Ahy_A01g003620 [Arachis hypogaea]|uniref:Uncharacterized protein n=1 Tax=Arachis hypogaea TaxID=3818 RepID=A0A445ETT8_ARAHY|nr:hypothetical protein Ahy_A01g003620 [Arachis hypogaea]
MNSYPKNKLRFNNDSKEKRTSLARDWRPYWSAASKYERCYREVIHPVNGSELWKRTQYDDVIPPPYRRPSHRPVKKRK